MVFKGLFAFLAFNAAVSATRADVQCMDFTIPTEKLCKLFMDGFKPDCPEEIEVAYTLYQRGTKPTVIERKSIPDVVKNKNMTIFVVHGFRSNCKTPWMSDMKEKLLGKSDVNVILVDWRKGAKPLELYYPKAARNVQTVGHDIAGIMDALNATGVEYRRMWCIGHSLGGHTCGHAGRNIKNYGTNKIGRITGLDPAGPCFRPDPEPCSLMMDNADFVDVIHTDGGDSGIHFGKHAPMGTLDFYPNTGKHQPECGGLYEQNQNMSTMQQNCPEEGHALPCETDAATYGGTICSHARAHVYFRNSINGSACSFKATKTCTDYKKIPDSCVETNTPAKMGYYADPSHKGLYYLDVTSLGRQCYTENGVCNKAPSVYLFVLVAVRIIKIIVA